MISFIMRKLLNMKLFQEVFVDYFINQGYSRRHSLNILARTINKAKGIRQRR